MPFAVEEIVFQHDPHPKHTAKSVLTQTFSILDWPARNLDLNPIEDLWGILKKNSGRIQISS